MLENSSLRESLAGMEKQLVELLNEKQAVLRRDKVSILLTYVRSYIKQIMHLVIFSLCNAESRIRAY